MSTLYAGRRMKDRVEVTVIIHNQGQNARKRKLRHVRFHSAVKDDLNWGYGGSGPADLALSILVDHFQEHPPRRGYLDPEFSKWTVKSRAWELHQDFKRHFIAKFPNEWALSNTQIERWLQDIDTRKEA
jgi:hypothetical protein